MLHEFLETHREELVQRCRTKVANRPAPHATDLELQHGVPLFLDQLIDALRSEVASPRESTSKLPAEIGVTAGRHGHELLRKGFTVDQVVHDYGDLCQSVTELAAEHRAPVSVDEFRTFNRCLDNAIADAVTEFARSRDEVVSDQGSREMNERLGSLAHELRNLLGTATLAFDAIKSGGVAVTGATGAVLDRSLSALRDLVDRSLADVRLSAGLTIHRQPIELSAFFEDLRIAATLDAKSKGMELSVSPVDSQLVVDADRQLLGSAVSNLLQNAFKYSRPQGLVSLTTRVAEDRILIEIEDECGGLSDGTIEELFRPFEQRSQDRSGLGLGLSISRRAVEANGGRLYARNVAEKGCVFTIDLPRSAKTALR